MGFYVIECQANATGAVIPVWYDNEAQADQKYHMILSAAAVSNVEKHGAIKISDDFRILKREIYDRTPGAEEIDQDGDEG